MTQDEHKQLQVTKLKIKNKHLSEEAKIIRHEERKLHATARRRWDKYVTAGNCNQMTYNQACWWDGYNNLRTHRIEDVRNEQRATFLARAFLQGKAYKDVEPYRRTTDDANWVFWGKVFPRVATMVYKYGYRFRPNSQTRRMYTEQDVRAMVKDWIKQ